MTTKSFVSACEAGSVQGDFNGHIIAMNGAIRFWFNNNMNDMDYEFNCIIVNT